MIVRIALPMIDQTQWKVVSMRGGQAALTSSEDASE
jgi:hypothetical protein